MSDPTEGHNVGNVVGGYKAAANNDNNSKEAQEHAKEMVDKIENGDGDLSGDYKPPAE